MKTQVSDVPRASLYRRPAVLFGCTAGLLIVVSLFLSGGGRIFASPSTSSANTTSYPIKVYFSKSPDSVQTNFSAVFPVNRISPTLGVGTYAIQLLIAGPTLEERQAGYFSELNSMLSGSSACGFAGPDFQLTLNKKGSVSEPGTATLKFCRQTTSNGIGTDARVSAEISATLKQFPTITKVVILLLNGHCFGDESGQDLCLK